MKLTAGIRVRNGEPWAEECLQSLSGFVDAIVILDDGSTDRTPAICRSFPKVVHFVRWEKSFFHEGLDRNVVLALAKDTEPDWILIMDIDEVFEDAIAESIAPMMDEDEFAVWGFRMLHFWRSKAVFRVDGPWGHETLRHIHPRLFRNQPGAHFPLQTIHGAHVLGVEGRAAQSNILIRHFGYSWEDRIIDKYRLYSQIDPGGDHRHLIDDKDAVLVEYVEGMDLSAALEFLNADCH